MAEQQKCKDCGAQLEPNSTGELCPKCLMKLGLQGQSKLGSNPDLGPTADVPSGAMPESQASVKSGGRFVLPPREQLEPFFPQLDILETLGQGGMGVVYKVRQRHLGRLAALKILPPEVAQDARFSERFTREARALASLTHPNIVAVYDFGQTGIYYYILMEYVDGLNLRHVLQTKSLKPGQALAIVPQVCDALQYAHEEGVVHRDIKPENILMDKRGRVKIADFGLAKLLGIEPLPGGLTATNQVLGTPQYMAPEQLERPAEVDHRVDIYSLGVIIYEMLTGELPLGRFALPSQKVEVDVRLDEVVLKALAKEPHLRYQQVSEVKTAVEDISEPDSHKGPAGKAQSRATHDLGQAIRDRVHRQIAGVAAAISGPGKEPAEVNLCQARSEVIGPAVGLFVMGLLYLATPLTDMDSHPSYSVDPGHPLGWVLGAAVLLVSALTLANLRYAGLAKGAAVLVLLMGPLVVVRVLLALWTWAILERREVKAAFEHVAAHPESAPWIPTRRQAIIGGAIAIVLAMLLSIPVFTRRSLSPLARSFDAKAPIPVSSSVSNDVLFVQFMDALSRAQSDQGRMDLLRVKATRASFTAEQVQQLVALFSTDETRLQAARVIYPHLNSAHKKDFYLVSNVLSTDEARAKLRELIEEQDTMNEKAEQDAMRAAHERETKAARGHTGAGGDIYVEVEAERQARDAELRTKERDARREAELLQETENQRSRDAAAEAARRAQQGIQYQVPYQFFERKRRVQEQSGQAPVKLAPVPEPVPTGPNAPVAPPESPTPIEQAPTGPGARQDAARSR